MAIAARERGASVVLIDRGVEEAGDPAAGRLARASLMASAARAHAIRTANNVGIDRAEPKPNFRAISEQAAARVGAISPRLSPERLNALGITYLEGEPSFSARTALLLGEHQIEARHFVLATGARPRVPPIAGLDQVPYFTPDSILANIRKLTHLVVIGGDATALELAQAYRRLGSAVTLVPHGPLLAAFDPELVALLVRALRDEGVVILEGADVAAIQPRNQGTGVLLRHADGSEDTLDVSHVLVSQGRQPELDGEWLAKLKLRRDPDRPDTLLLNRHGQTSNGRVSAIAGAAGEERPHAASRQADILLDRLLLGQAVPFDSLAVPSLVATEPGLAQVGQLELSRHLRAGQSVLRASLAEIDGARALGDASGVAKLILGRQGEICGGAMLGAAASEIAAMLALAIVNRLPAAELARLALPQTSPAAVLVDLGRQAAALRPVSAGRKRLMALRRLLP